MAFVPYGDVATSTTAIKAGLFYLAIYAVTSFGIWAIVTMLEKNEGGGLELEHFSGLGRKYPLVAVCLLIFLLSFIGIPPLLGFWGKLTLFRTALEGGYLSLAVIGILTSLLSAYYYLKVVYFMFMRGGEPELQQDKWALVIMTAAAVLIILLGLVPGFAFSLTNIPPLL